MLHLLSALPQEQYDIYVISRSDGTLPDKVKEHGWTHIPLDSFVQQISFSDFVTAVRLYKIIRKIKPDIVHTHSSKPGFLGRIIARIVGTPLVIHTIHGFPFHDSLSSIVYHFYRTLESFAARFAHVNVSVNKYERDLAIQKMCFSPERIITIYNGIAVIETPLDPKVGTPFMVSETTMTEGINAVPTELRIVSVSRFTSQKNHLATFPLLIAIVKKYPQVSFTFFGDGELFSQCQAMVLSSQTTDNIILKGWIENPLELLCDYNVFFLNSLWEGLSISILEAMSVGLPIICSDIKGNNELVDRENGWLIDAKDDTSIEKIIIEILSDKKCLQRKGNVSRQRVIEQFSLQAMVDAYREIYEHGKW